jgi:hypothetical protein
MDGAAETSGFLIIKRANLLQTFAYQVNPPHGNAAPAFTTSENYHIDCLVADFDGFFMRIA